MTASHPGRGSLAGLLPDLLPGPLPDRVGGPAADPHDEPQGLLGITGTSGWE
ncbi:hypothetical protein GCM10027162_61770 [Streptomyces incanus]